jgi:hypothetical protein
MKRLVDPCDLTSTEGEREAECETLSELVSNYFQATCLLRVTSERADNSTDVRFSPKNGHGSVSVFTAQNNAFSAQDRV